MSDKQIEYSVFCIENVAKELGIYEALHTQSKQYIVNEIISVLKERNLVA